MISGIHALVIPVYAFVILFSVVVPLSTSDQGSPEYVGQQFISNACYPYSSRKRRIEVTNVFLLCDSQDEEGYQYSNSLTCQPGDLAKATIDFTLSKVSNDSESIYIDIDSSGLGRTQKIRNETNLCDFAHLFYQGDGYQAPYGSDDDVFGDVDDFYSSGGSSACPLKRGPYTLYTSFLVPEYLVGVDVEFTPGLQIIFASRKSDNSGRLLGCAETGSWALLSFNKQKQKKGQRLFLAAFFIFVAFFAACLIGHRRKQKEGERAKVKRAASMMRRFHYIRSTRSGDLSIPPSHSSMSGSFVYGEALPSPSPIIEVS